MARMTPESQIVAHIACKIRGWHRMDAHAFAYCAYKDEACLDCGEYTPEDHGNVLRESLWEQRDAGAPEVTWPA